MSHLTCPTCGLALYQHALLLSPRYCPRCLARRATAVPLVSWRAAPSSPRLDTRPGAGRLTTRAGEQAHG